MGDVCGAAASLVAQLGVTGEEWAALTTIAMPPLSGFAKTEAPGRVNRGHQRLTRSQEFVPSSFHGQADGADAWSGASRRPAGEDYGQYCQITRHFDPTDLERLLGDLPFTYALGAMKCEKCWRRDYLVGALTIPTAEERNRIRVRRLVDVRHVRKVVWRDE